MMRVLSVCLVAFVVAVGVRGGVGATGSAPEIRALAKAGRSLGEGQQSHEEDHGRR